MDQYSQNQTGFHMNEAKCPECSAPLRIPPDAEWATCSYCGTTVHVTYPRQQTGVEPDGTIRDRSTGYGLFRVKSATGFSVTGTSLQRMGSVSRPYVAQVQLQDRAGGTVDLRMGDAGTRNSAGMNALLGMYGGHLAGVSTVNYADVPDPLALADATAGRAASGMGATGLRFERQLAYPNLEAKYQKSYELFQEAARSEGAHIANPFIAVVLRTYEFACNGQPWKAAVYVELGAVKDAMGIDGGLGAGMLGGLGDLMGSIGGLFGGGNSMGGLPNPFGGQLTSSVQVEAQDDQYSGVVGFLRGGGLVGKMKRDRDAAQAQAMRQQAAPQQVWQQPVASQQAWQQPGQPMQQAYPGQQAYAPAQGQFGQPGQFGSQDQFGQSGQFGQQAYAPAQGQSPAQQAGPQAPAWCMPDMAEYTKGGTIYWNVAVIATFVAPADDFDKQLQSAFLPLVSGIEIHPDVVSLSRNVSKQETAAVQQATQSQLARNQAAFEAQQAAVRQQQAAFDSYNQSVMAASDARHRQFMESSRAQFDHHAPDYSEAIRGVNTYTTSDGREVQISVQADRAYENQAGDVIGTSGSFDPGANWTEIPRT